MQRRPWPVYRVLVATILMTVLARFAYLKLAVPHTTPKQSKPILIAVMGATGSGKTTFINKASGDELRVGSGLRSCTDIIQVSKPFALDGRWVTLIDTPGFDDTTKSDTDILTMIAAFLETTYEQGEKLSGVIYMHRISDPRMGGISTRNFRMFKELCGEDSLKNVILVSNMWSEVSSRVGEARERELATDEMFFKPVLDKGAQFLRNDNTDEGARTILRHIIGNHPLPLRIQRELVDEGKNISHTAAGVELLGALHEQAKKYEAEMHRLEKDMEDALRHQDNKRRLDLEDQERKLREEIERNKREAEKLRSDETAQLRQRLKELSDESKLRSEQAEAYKRRMDDLEEQLRNIKASGDGGSDIEDIFGFFAKTVFALALL